MLAPVLPHCVHPSGVNYWLLTPIDIAPFLSIYMYPQIQPPFSLPWLGLFSLTSEFALIQPEITFALICWPSVYLFLLTGIFFAPDCSIWTRDSCSLSKPHLVPPNLWCFLWYFSLHLCYSFPGYQNVMIHSWRESQSMPLYHECSTRFLAHSTRSTMERIWLWISSTKICNLQGECEGYMAQYLSRT